MKKILVMLCAGAAASLSTAPAAFADYTILADRAMPSVVFVDFDEDTEDRIAMQTSQSGGAGSSTDPSVVTLDEGDTAAVTSLDPEDAKRNLPQQVSKASASESESGPRTQAPTPAEIEKMIVDREIEDRVFEQIELR